MMIIIWAWNEDSKTAETMNVIKIPEYLTKQQTFTIAENATKRIYREIEKEKEGKNDKTGETV